MEVKARSIFTVQKLVLNDIAVEMVKRRDEDSINIDIDEVIAIISFLYDQYKKQYEDSQRDELEGENRL